MIKKRTSQKPLTGRVALVAGATRGAGRGIARALAEAGATVYCTGRSVKGKSSPYGRPETIDETAAIIKATGGSAHALRVDHTRENFPSLTITSDYGGLRYCYILKRHFVYPPSLVKNL